MSYAVDRWILLLTLIYGVDRQNNITDEFGTIIYFVDSWNNITDKVLSLIYVVDWWNITDDVLMLWIGGILLTKFWQKRRRGGLVEGWLIYKTLKAHATHL